MTSSISKKGLARAVPARRCVMLPWRKNRLQWRTPLKSIVRLAVGLVALLSAGAALAQTYPDKPVRVVVGFAAGGPTDAIARIVSDKLSVSLGKQFYVVNQPGAGSNTASGMVAAAPNDGYT